MEDPYIRPKFSELRRRFALAKSLPVEYIINFRLVNANANAAPDAAFTAAETLETKFLLYLVEGDNTRLGIPKDLYQTFLVLAHDKNNHAGIDRTYQRLRQHYFITGFPIVRPDCGQFGARECRPSWGVMRSA
jgi:hypothetical protein